MAAAGILPPDVALRRHVENALSPDTVAGRPALVDRLVAHERTRPQDPGAWSAQAAAGARHPGRGRPARRRARPPVLPGDTGPGGAPRTAQHRAERTPTPPLVP